MNTNLTCVVAPCAFWHRCENCERVACWTTLYGPYCGLCLLAEPPEDFGRASARPIGMEVSYFCCEGESPQVFNRCQWPAMIPKDEERLRDAYFSRPPYWNKDHDFLELLGSLDEARRQRDEARAQLAAALVLLKSNLDPIDALAWFEKHGKSYLGVQEPESLKRSPPSEPLDYDE